MTRARGILGLGYSMVRTRGIHWLRQGWSRGVLCG